jgi:hypothetical protein
MCCRGFAARDSDSNCRIGLGPQHNQRHGEGESLRRKRQDKPNPLLRHLKPHDITQNSPYAISGLRRIRRAAEGVRIHWNATGFDLRRTARSRAGDSPHDCGLLTRADTAIQRRFPATPAVDHAENAEKTRNPVPSGPILDITERSRVFDRLLTAAGFTETHVLLIRDAMCEAGLKVVEASDASRSPRKSRL